MAETTAAEHKTNHVARDFVAITAPRVGVHRRIDNRLWVIDPGRTEARRRDHIRMRALAPLVTALGVALVCGAFYALAKRAAAMYRQALAEQPAVYEAGFGDGLVRQATAASSILVVLFAGIGLLMALPAITSWLMDGIGARALRLPHGFCTRLGSVAWFRAVDQDNPAARRIHRELWKVARIEEARTRARVDLGSPDGRDVVAVWDETAAELARLRVTYVDWYPEPAVRAQPEPADATSGATDPRTLELRNLIAAARGEQDPR